MNTLNFKTYKEFEKEMIDDLDNDEKLDLYNQYCEYNNDLESMIYPNDDDFLETMFGSDVSAVAKAITYGDYKYNDKYVKFNGYGNLQSYNGLQAALEDNFDYDDLIDFIAEDKNIDFNDLYIEYIENTLDEAQDFMSSEEFSEALKEYTSEEMIKKYPEVCDNIDRNYSDFILDEKDTDKSKDIDDDWER
jgi:hypothetical protein